MYFDMRVSDAALVCGRINLIQRQLAVFAPARLGILQGNSDKHQ
jgi:hypothetical protein